MNSPPATILSTASAGAFGVTRDAPLRRLVGATRFSAEPDLRDPVKIVRLIKSQRGLMEKIEEGFGVRCDPLDADADPVEFDLPRRGRPGLRGSWPLAFVAFTLTPGASIEAWADSIASSAVWRACGFTDPPSYQTICRQFAHLERFTRRRAADGSPLPDGFYRASCHLVAAARRHEPEVGRAVVVDGSANSTRAALVHCCPTGTACGDRQAQIARRRAARGAKATAPKAAGHGSRVPMTTVDEANRQRHEDHRQPADREPSRGERKLAMVRLDDAEAERLGLDTELLWWAQRDAKGQTHYFCCRDRTVGLRNYRGRRQGGRGRGKFWVGWTIQKATDLFTGGPLAVINERADRQEYDIYPDLLLRAFDVAGAIPQVVSADRGQGVKSVYEFNSAHGIGSAIPWRMTTQHHDRGELEDEKVDRHGVPRCRHCGGPGKTKGRALGFTVTAHGTPVIRFRCALRLTGDCSGIQSVRCSHEPRLLQPLAINERLYNQAREAHENREHVHLHDRQRYTVGGRDAATGDHRLGADWQTLRLHAAMFLDWLRICLRGGWLGTPRTNPNEPDEVSDGGRLAKILASRAKYQLALPYGPQAARRRLGFHDPPWITKPPPRTRRNGRLRA